MPREYIEVRGARENNLKNVSLRYPQPEAEAIENLSIAIVVEPKRPGSKRTSRLSTFGWQIGLAIDLCRSGVYTYFCRSKNSLVTNISQKPGAAHGA